MGLLTPPDCPGSYTCTGVSTPSVEVKPLPFLGHLSVFPEFSPLPWGMLYLETTALFLVRTGVSPKLVLFLSSAYFFFFFKPETGPSDLPKDKASQGQRWLRTWYLDSAHGFFQYTIWTLFCGKTPS